jgi:hypothetical protein
MILFQESTIYSTKEIMEINRPKIFISHSWEDKSFVHQLEPDLKSAGADVWIDHSEIRGGDNLPKRICEALEWCDTLLLIWSEAAENSTWVELEWSNAISLRKKIVPCMLGKNKLPAVLACKVYIDFQNYRSGLSQLLRALKLYGQSDTTQDDINKISKLFLLRDEAVLEKDQKKFLETQLKNQEINNGSSKGYLTCSKVTTSILNIAASKYDRDFPVEYVAMIKEDYEHSNQFSHSGYIIYTLSRVNGDFKIRDLQIVIAFP